MKHVTHSFFSTPVLIGGVVILVFIGFIPYFDNISKTYVSNHKSVARGIIVGNIDARNMSEDDLRSVLEDFQQKINEQGIASIVNNQSGTLREPQSLDPDIPLRQDLVMIAIDYDSTIRNAFSSGNSPSLVKNVATRAKLLLIQEHIPISIVINRELFTKSLETLFPTIRRDAQQADISYNSKTKQFEIIPERPGILFDSDSAIKSLTTILGQGILPTLSIRTIEQQPLIKSNDIETLIPGVQKLLRNITLTTDADHSWIVKKLSLAQWLTVTCEEGGAPTLTTRNQDIKTYLETSIAPTIFIESKDPRFEIIDGKIIISAQPQNGKKLELDKSVQLISKAILDTKTDIVTLPVSEYPSTVLTIPSYDAIKEIITQAETDFKGSPKNRRLNISNGASRINGILVQPNEEFSLLHYLEPIDDTTGFLPELVIKGNKTKPEFGGGLCQVSTTLFRAIAFAGLPITMRRNHSYRVGYYEPPVGFDATIYSPAPDFKFKNDMSTPILIQTKVSGTKIMVILWGTKDGRISDVDKPTVYNIKKPLDTKLIETTELKPGEKKCTEKAHSGADAYFERRVIYPSGEIKKETFKSHYVVWPAVCYIGKPEPEVSLTIPEEQTPSVIKN